MANDENVYIFSPSVILLVRLFIKKKITLNMEK